MKLRIIEDNRGSVFNIHNPGDYVYQYTDDCRVGKVSGHDYQKFDKGRDSKIVYMDADHYIDYCAKNIFHSSRDYVMEPVEEDKVHKYANAMKEGNTFPVPYLDFIYEQQEGRHRALAYAEAFGDTAGFPVLIIYKAEPTLEEIDNYVKQRFSNYHDSYFKSYAESFGFSEKEIYEYLGLDYDEPEDEVDPDFDVDWEDLDIEYDDLDIGDE